MSESVLILLAQPETARQLLWAAARATASIGPVHYEVLAVRMPPEATILPTEEILSQEDCERIRAEEAERVAQLHAIYGRWVQGLDTALHHADWIDVEGLAGKEMAARGVNADLLVIDRVPERFSQAASDAAHAAIFDCHRPVLIIPPTLRAPSDAVFGACVAIAWKDDGRAIKAVIPAARYFSQARDVIILEGYRGDAVPTELPAAIVERDIDCRLVPIKIGSDSFGQTLLERAGALGADILVMGAYAHSEFTEMLFAGVTRYVLHHADMPVLLRH